MPASSWNLKLFLGLLFGDRIVRLAPLHIPAFLDQMANLVWGDGQLTLRADIQRGSDQEIVAPSISLC